MKEKWLMIREPHKKVRPYRTPNENEKLFMDGLFPFKSMPVMTAENISDNRFGDTVAEIESNLNSKANKQKIFDKSSLDKRRWVVLMMIAAFVLISVNPILEYDAGLGPLFILAFPIIGFFVLISFAFNLGFVLSDAKGRAKLFGIVFGALFGGGSSGGGSGGGGGGSW